MENTVYYIVKQFKKQTDNLFDFVEKHSYTKYGDKWETSVFAYQTLYNGLKKVYGLTDYDLDFLDGGKPVLSGYSISVSHTNGAVAVAFTKGDKVNSLLRKVKRFGSDETLSCVVCGKKAQVIGKVGLTDLIIDVTGIDCGIGDVAAFEFNPTLVDALVKKDFV